MGINPAAGVRTIGELARGDAEERFADRRFEVTTLAREAISLGQQIHAEAIVIPIARDGPGRGPVGGLPGGREIGFVLRRLVEFEQRGTRLAVVELQSAVG